MKKFICICLSVASCSGAFAQVTLYNNLGASAQEGFWDVDGGATDTGTPYGGQAGQVITDLAGGDTISYIAADYLGFQSTSGATGLYVSVYNYSGGVVGSLVGQETVGVLSELDEPATGGFLGSGYNQFNLDADLSISGLVAGQQYLVAMQVQGPNLCYLMNDLDGNMDAYVEDYSNFGNPGIYGIPSWTESSSVFGAGISGDNMMEVQAISSTPEPFTMSALGLGLVAVLRRRKLS